EDGVPASHRRVDRSAVAIGRVGRAELENIERVVIRVVAGRTVLGIDYRDPAVLREGFCESQGPEGLAAPGGSVDVDLVSDLLARWGRELEGVAGSVQGSWGVRGGAA